MKNGNWIQLRSGGGYDFDTKTIFGPFTVKDDLAYPLGCPRYTRHTAFPWSVALHSVAVARTIEALTGSKTAAAAGLLHDAHEAVIGDITTPVARHIDYARVAELKADVQCAIHMVLELSFDLLPERHPEVAMADAAALTVERRLMMTPEPRAWNYRDPAYPFVLEMHNQVLGLMPDVKRGTDVVVFCEEYARLVLPLVDA